MKQETLTVPVKKAVFFRKSVLISSGILSLFLILAYYPQPKNSFDNASTASGSADTIVSEVHSE
ncbi:MAG: hypothetical protein ABL872_12735, partial [Lacibacter sp.]